MRSLALAAAALAAGCAGWRPGGPPRPLVDDFAGDGPLSSEWTVTSGAMERRGGAAWSASPVLRVVSSRTGFSDVQVDLKLKLDALAPAGPDAHDWDGVHVFVRYRTQYELYVVTLARRDDKIVIKKKLPGGPSNGGTYAELAPPTSWLPPLGEWQAFRVVVRDRPQGVVAIDVYAGDRLVAAAVDDGRFGPPVARGRVGLRGDNASFSVDEFRVTPLTPGP